MSATLEQFIAQQAQLLQKMEAVLARNLPAEYAYREGNVGVDKVHGVCDVIDTYSTAPTLASTSLAYTFGTQIYVKEIRLSFVGRTVIQTLNSGGDIICLKVDFSDDQNFGRFITDWVHPVVGYAFSLTSSNTAEGVYRANYEKTWPLRKRYVRVTPYNFAQTTQIALSGYYLSTSKINLTFLGQ